MNMSYQDLFAEWDRLLAAVQANEGDFPALTAYKVALEGHLESVKAARAHQMTLQAEYQGATRELQEKVAAGKDEVRRLRCRLKAELGLRNPRLRLFGIAPLGEQKPRPRLPALVFVTPVG